ncbi:SAF domain-containing protein [Rossellomorea marisflavi]|uniref:SAF domain-containing protein n=1 Tax=Rossellomorea marisflavi TaxID=189381 RepID=UPI003F9F033E
MAKKKMSTQGKWLTGIMLFAGATFGYQNIYAPNVVMKEEGLVYVARADIPAYTEVDASMFQAVPVQKHSILKGSVTDIAQVQGKQLSGSLKSGEQLFSTRLTTDEVPEGELLTEVKIESKLPVKDNDNIRIFVKSKEKGNLFVVEELFKSKKVYTKSTIFGIPEDGSQQPQSSKGMEFFLKLSQDEVLKYEEAVSTGEIVAVKILGDEEVSKNVRASKSGDTKLVSEKQPKVDESSRGSVEYTVKDGESMKDIADKFVTSEDKISELNDGKTDVKAGDKILVPAI